MSVRYGFENLDRMKRLTHALRDDELRRKENFGKNKVLPEHSNSFKLSNETCLDTASSPNAKQLSTSAKVLSKIAKSPFRSDTLKEEPRSVDPHVLVRAPYRPKEVRSWRSKYSRHSRASRPAKTSSKRSNYEATSMKRTKSLPSMPRPSYLPPPKASVVCVSLVVQPDGAASLVSEDMNDMSRNQANESCLNSISSVESDFLSTNLTSNSDFISSDLAEPYSFIDDLGIGMQRSVTWSPGFKPFQNDTPSKYLACQSEFPLECEVRDPFYPKNPIQVDSISSGKQFFGNFPYPDTFEDPYSSEMCDPGSSLMGSHSEPASESVTMGGEPMRLCFSDSTLCDARVAAKQALIHRKQGERKEVLKDPPLTPPSKNMPKNDNVVLFHSSPLFDRLGTSLYHNTKPSKAEEPWFSNFEVCSEPPQPSLYSSGFGPEGTDELLDSSFCNDW
ncbi:MBF transcription factor complex subunit Rep1 [Schizosaccharomyces cryophilus OY26]|uniref:MBF transcription factor complex subunit Rep1 n=1 Tax=Schizosaccharomyces cryophilus (strain OY26 / ATCC MYA-4695 / CBS 11777 / NBRC 106824 / NRRL Y48691) TaxID=653667 RepID=S9X9X3_SCHCR|nr:MBF transcription factor complex subunit Rep1 [Schizosaccharomyces cryophilus OY26]EPY53932.1 MBF transcription factor complex subunit Rep1 [Schizosaccharomyces cryophilus OY26]